VIAVSKSGIWFERWVWLILVTSIAFAAPFEIKPLEVKSGKLTVTIHDPQDEAQLGTVFKTFNKAQKDLAEIGLGVKPVMLEAFSSANAFARATGEPAFVAASTRDQTIRTQRLGALQPEDCSGSRFGTRFSTQRNRRVYGVGWPKVWPDISVARMLGIQFSRAAWNLSRMTNWTNCCWLETQKLPSIGFISRQLDAL
jgi:hypothetical protein